jgi:hypothetical protein
MNEQIERENALLAKQNAKLQAIKNGKVERLNLGVDFGLLSCGHNSALLVEGMMDEGDGPFFVSFCQACGY